MATINVTVRDRVTNLGISNGIIVLYDIANNTQTTQTTDSSGVASFTNVALGDFSVYNTFIAANATPPTVCGFPTGYTGTTFARRLDTTITTSGQTVALNFNFDKPVPWSTLNGGNPPNSAITLQNFVNLATGALTPITPSIANNGMGYNTMDNMLYGASGRSDTTTTVALNYPDTYVISSVIGDCDTDGHFYTAGIGSTFTCIDVDPTRTTYLRPLDPYNNFDEVTVSPFTITYTQSPNGNLGINDWSYVPAVLGLVSAVPANNVMWVLSLTTPRAYNPQPTVVGPVAGGVSFSDSKNFYIPTGSQILKYAMSTTIARGSILSNSTLSVAGDGARAVNAPVFFAQPIVKKTVSENFGATGDTLIFTVTIANTGLTTGNNSFFQDTIPAGVEFITNSVFLNGVQQNGVTPDFVELGTLPVGVVFTVTFSGLITTDTLPAVTNTSNVTTSFFDTATATTFTSTFASNITLTTLPTSELTSSKLVNKASAGVGETLTYTLVLENTGEAIVTNCTVLDTTPNGTNFVSNSLKVNGVTITGGTLFPSGFNVGTIAVGARTTLTFNVLVTSFPTPNPIPNSASETFNYIIDPTTTPNRLGSGSSATNIVNTQINGASLSGITKLVDKAFATCGDTIAYTIVLPNSGNVTAINVVVTDTIPAVTTLVPNTVTVDGSLQAGANPANGVTIPTIGPGASSTITFQVKVQC